MSILTIRSHLHGHIDELFSADLRRSSDAENQQALKTFLTCVYSSLASLAWHLGADGNVFQREALPASELTEDAFYELNREREFSGGGTGMNQRLVGTHNHRQQF
ncbi:hypothetical protein QN224_15875 [Sinorhizobium sp. 8-89]|uniref:hypothetical protein n=1 Tax=Sinorhizobium sp. 7-81 TaxID=3049087 RepID=UPI0024C3AF86|nr:hypothetical protein [Sinorhizobium sp. 7-81]MDK1386888.1 hypothetical protein [Sinorhizobium sp. 7-81]